MLIPAAVGQIHRNLITEDESNQTITSGVGVPSLAEGEDDHCGQTTASRGNGTACDQGMTGAG